MKVQALALSAALTTFLAVIAALSGVMAGGFGVNITFETPQEAAARESVVASSTGLSATLPAGDPVLAAPNASSGALMAPSEPTGEDLIVWHDEDHEEDEDHEWEEHRDDDDMGYEEDDGPWSNLVSNVSAAWSVVDSIAPLNLVGRDDDQDEDDDHHDEDHDD